MTKQTQSLRIIFISTTGFVLLLSILSYTRINTLIESSQLVNHTTRVTLGLETMIGNLKDAETGQHGYLLTHDSRFLETYNDGLKEYPTYLSQVEELTKDNPVQQGNLRQVETLTKNREDYMRRMFEIDKTRTPTATEMLIGKSLMDSLLVQVNKMIDVENNLMAQRTQELKKQTALAPALLFILIVAALTILIISFGQLNRALLKRLQTEQELKQKNITLEKMDRELASFTYISSHDLQEPLRKIQMFSKRIEEKELNALSDNGKNYFHRITNAAERMQQLIKDLLAYSRTNTAEQHFEKRELNKIIEEVITELKDNIEEKHATIETRELLEEVRIIPFQFQQLIQNLMDNALKFSKSGTPPHIIIKSRIINHGKLNNEKNLPGKKYCHILVTDNGIGFEPQFNEQIFGLFQRLHGRSEYEGTGIGLSICKKIAENHNGIITAQGEPGKGATFNIYIPAN